jgi:hypothetical protein
MHQIDRGLHRFGAADGLEDGGHGIGMGHRVLAGLHGLGGDQRLGEAARTR